MTTFNIYDDRIVGSDGKIYPAEDRSFVDNSGQTFYLYTAKDVTLSGGGGNDVVWGGNGADTLSGNGGSDTLTGGFGADILYGNAGDDLIFDGRNVGSEAALGRDTVRAGAGNDTIYYAGSTDGAQLYGDKGLPPETISITLRGSAGQSLGAFNAPGVHITLIG